MSREPKSCYRQTTKRWVCTIDGKRITLGPDKKTAHDKFHELMLNQNQVASELSTVHDLSQVYLDWCEQNRSRGTYANQKHYLESFINSIGRRLKIGALKTHDITKWLESFDCTSTSSICSSPPLSLDENSNWQRRRTSGNERRLAEVSIEPSQR